MPRLQTPVLLAGVLSALLTGANAQTATATSTRTTTAAPQITAVSDCHFHDATQFCMVGATEYVVLETFSATTGVPESYVDCHAHGGDIYCMEPTGSNEVQITLAGAEETAAATTAAPTATATSHAAETFESLTDCHMHSTDIYCMAGAAEYVVVDPEVTATQDLPAQYTSCHTHDAETFCQNEHGDDVQVLTEAAAEDTATEEETTTTSSTGQNCHFHAGVEHCVGAGESESGATSSSSCQRVDRDYKIGLRIGLIFVVLATSLLGVFIPILVQAFLPNKLNLPLCILKQFGTGIIISTALVHLYTHANLLFTNECIGDLGYEGTTSAVLMAGIFVSFLVEFLGQRFLQWQNAKKAARSAEQAGVTKTTSQELLNIYVMEAGIIFHSLLIGITLVVAGDSYFMTLFIVIVFHQFFEAIALGSRIAALGTGQPVAGGLASLGHRHIHVNDKSSPMIAARSPSDSDADAVAPVIAQPISFIKKSTLAVCFAITTPIGMAIGIGVLNQFNGNDKATAITIATLDAFSGGILVWVGVVEMLAGDWMFGGEMTEAGPVMTLTGLASLVAGMILMSFLGKWA